MNRTTLSFFCFFICISINAQQSLSDTSILDEVTIRAFEQYRKPSSAVSTVSILDERLADRSSKLSLVTGFNSIAGVRMEERSPGSYRINIRGSSLRSPFGVRNVKVYWNDLPVTDPGGNTYFNQFVPNNFSTLEIFKGPAGSLYGAGTGGLILMNNFDRWMPGASAEYVTGSYNLRNVFVSARFGNDNSKNQVTYAHNSSDGYRIQSKMRRDNISFQSQMKISERHQLTASFLYNDMYYQTPGALTLTEFNNNPKAARPAGGGFPSAVNAHAAIEQKTLLAGFSNMYVFNSTIKNSTALYGSFAQIRNSAIRNYERRNEPSYGGRTTFTFGKNVESPLVSGLRLIAGAEYQQGLFNTQVAQNRNGNPDTLQTNDDVNYVTYSLFTQAEWLLARGWSVNAGVSLNKTQVTFARLSSYPIARQKRNYRNELAPRLAIRKDINQNLYLKGTMSRGFSPPTVAELLPSTSVISTDLEAEYGWNYELGAHLDVFNKALRLELTGILFKLNNALVQRRDLSGADFFVNAGDVRQKAIEFSADFRRKGNGIVKLWQLNSAYTYSHFRYGSFVKGTDNFSGKTVPSVPAHTASLFGDMNFKHGLYIQLSFYAASKIFLNDANTASSSAYEVLGSRIGWQHNFGKTRLNLYAGADNLTDEIYSLGNDINAAANRFYNAAPRRNWYMGAKLEL